LKGPPKEIADEIDVSRELDGSNRSRDFREGSRNMATSSHAHINSIHPSAVHVNDAANLIRAWSFPLLARMPKLTRLQEKYYVKIFTLYYSVCG
jgi:hypothetical protein